MFYFAVRTSKSSQCIDDQTVLDVVKKNLELDFIGQYELTSIVSLDEEKVTTVIVNTGSIDIAFEIDNETGNVLTKEKLIR